MTDEPIQTKLTQAERLELTEWCLKADAMVELVDVLTLSAEMAGAEQNTRVKRLRLLRKALETVGDSCSLVYREEAQ